MVALIDIDDTLASMQLSIIEFLNTRIPGVYKFDSITLEHREGEDRVYQKHLEEFLSSPDLVIGVKPYPFAKKSLEMLKDAGYQLHVASARKSLLHQPTENWLIRHGFVNYLDGIHPRPDNQSSTLFKQEVAMKINATVAFDDTQKIAEALSNNGVLTYLINKPWNAHAPNLKNLVRANNLKQAVDHLLQSK